jgi:hypothetical protein
VWDDDDGAGQCRAVAAGPAAGLRGDRERARGARPGAATSGGAGGLAGVGASSVALEELVSVYAAPQFARLQLPYNQVMGGRGGAPASGGAGAARPR